MTKKNRKIVRKQAITLLEMMLVILLIGIIGSIVGYNMKGSLDKGKAFKSEQGSKQVHDLLMLKVAEGTSIAEIQEHAKTFLEESGLVNNPDKLFKDGWNQDFTIKQISEDDFIVYSHAWEKFLEEKKKYSKEKLQQEFPWAFHFDEDEL